MNDLTSGLIDKNGNHITCSYYEIEALCKKIIEQYCLISRENNQIFVDFSKDYTYFSPYFDFVVGYLGYSLLNPFFKPNSILCGDVNNRSYITKVYSPFLEDYVPLKYGSESFGFSSDKDLQIKPFLQENYFYNCFVNPELLEFVPPVKGHRELGKQLLNLAMIKDRELFEKIIQLNISKLDTAEILMWYFPLFRFDDYLSNIHGFMLIYRSDNITNEQKELLEKLKKLECEKFIDDQAKKSLIETFDWSYKFYSEERRMKNANKRI